VAIRGFEQRYEVDDIMRLEGTRDAIPQDVRVLELLYPSDAFTNMLPGRIYPMLETPLSSSQWRCCELGFLAML
jgi:hypothetical protein